MAERSPWLTLMSKMPAGNDSEYLSFYNTEYDAASGEYYYSSAYFDAGYYNSTYGGWYYSSYDETGYSSGWTAETTEVAAMFDDVSYVEIGASGWSYAGYYWDANGIQFDNIEIA